MIRFLLEVQKTQRRLFLIFLGEYTLLNTLLFIWSMMFFNLHSRSLIKSDRMVLTDALQGIPSYIGWINKRKKHCPYGKTAYTPVQAHC